MAQASDKWNCFKRMRESGQISFPGQQNQFNILAELGIPGNLDRVIQMETADPSLPEDVDFEFIPGPGMNHLASYSELGPKPLIPHRPIPSGKSVFDRTPEYTAVPMVPEQIKNLDLSGIDLSDVPGPGEEHLALSRVVEGRKFYNLIQPKKELASKSSARSFEVSINHTENVSGIDIPVLLPGKH